MKKWILGLFALTVLAGPLHASGIGPMFGHWDTQDAVDDQGAGVRLTLDLGPSWNLEVRATWLDSFFLVGDGILFRVEAFPLDLGLSYGFETAGKFRPYVGAGITYLDSNPILLDSNLSNEIRARIAEEVGINFLVGTDYPIMDDKLSLFVEATYRAVETRVDSDEIRDFNVDMTGVGAAFGVVLNF